MKQLLCFFLALLCVACQEKTTPQPPDRANDAHTNANFVSLDREQLMRLELGLYEVSRETLRYEVKFLLTSLQVQRAKPLWAQALPGACKNFRQ
jgi:hypothetical protein